MTNDPSHPHELPQAAVEAIWKGNAIEAIKIVRLERDIGLKESKDLVDGYVRNHPALQQKMRVVQAEATQTIVQWLIGAILLAAAAYFFVSG